MKKIITLAFLSLAVMRAQAQIMISQSGFASWAPGTDSTRLVSLNIPPAAANVTADLSESIYSTFYTYPLVNVTNPAFPAATFQLAFDDAITSTTGSSLLWKSSLSRGISSNGIMTYGESITRQATGIGAATGNTADSVVIPAQNVIYTTARNTLKFPAAYQARWSNAYKSTVNFSVTVALYSLSNAAFSRVTTTTETDTIAGWGKMRLKTASGVNSSYMDVLAVKTKVRLVDSLMMGSAPAPPVMLAGLGFTQGAATDIYTISWYRAGEVTPLLRVNYFDSTYSTPIDAEAHMNRLATPASVMHVPGTATDIAISPNPIYTGSTLHIYLGDAAAFGQWSYELVNATGQVTAAASLSFTGARASLNLNTDIPPGIYYFNLRNNGQLAASRPLLIRN